MRQKYNHSVVSGNVNALAVEEKELETLAENVDKTCTRNYVDFSTEKTKLMANSANGIHREIKVKWQKLGNVITSNIFQLLSQMKAKNWSFSRIQHKPLQLLQRRNHFEETTVYLLDKR